MPDRVSKPRDQGPREAAEGVRLAGLLPQGAGYRALRRVSAVTLGL